jgi:quinolinate synthase
MKQITLPKILTALETLSPAIEVNPTIADRARQSVERMLELS